MRRSVLVVVLLLGACKKTEPARDACAKAETEGPLAWIHDDYAAARACAKARGVPLVLDLWAPWCHTCLSMQSTVFRDPSFAADATKFVFAALDTDREINAAAVDRYPMAAWPTFYVVDHDEKVLARFTGAASVAQFHAFLDAGARAHVAGAQAQAPPATAGSAGADAHLLAAERAVTAKDLALAEAELTAALAAAPPEWPRRADVLVSLISTKSKRKDIPGCLAVAEQSMDQTGNAASASDFLYHASTCATEAAKDPANAERVKTLRERTVARFQKLLADSATPMSVDDRSDAMMYLRDALIALARPDEARTVAEAQLAMLADAAAKAPTPTAAMTYNWPRAEVAVFLGRPLDLVPSLEKSAADLPTEYDPPARLGWIYFKAGKLEDAAKWTDKALALVYGPRKIRVLTQRAEIAAKLGDKATERAMRQQIVKTLEALPAGQTTPEAIAKAKQTLADLDKPPLGAGSEGSGNGSSSGNSNGSGNGSGNSGNSGSSGSGSSGNGNGSGHTGGGSGTGSGGTR